MPWKIVAPNGSKVAPEGHGNNNAPPPQKVKRNAGKKGWFLTLKWTHGIHYPMFRKIMDWIRTHCTRGKITLEKGDETGYEHFHMALEMKVKKRFEWFKHHLTPVCHCEVTRNEEGAYNYVSKEETRIWGPWAYPEPIGEPIKDEMEGLEFKPWQMQIKSILDGPIDQRAIYWYWGARGIGKPSFGKHLLIRYNACFLEGAAKKDMAYGWKGEPIIIIGFPYTYKPEDIPYDAIEALKDGLIFSSKYESGAKLHNRPHVICLANMPADTSKLDRIINIEILTYPSLPSPPALTAAPPTGGAS